MSSEALTEVKGKNSAYNYIRDSLSDKKSYSGQAPSFPQLDSKNSSTLPGVFTYQQIISIFETGIKKFLDTYPKVFEPIIASFEALKMKKLRPQDCVDEILKLITDQLDKLNQEDEGDFRKELPIDVAWFLWEYSSIERLKLRFQQPSDKAHQLLHLAQTGVHFVNKIIYKGGDTDIKFNYLKKEDQKKISKGMLSLRDELSSRCQDLSDLIETRKEEVALTLAMRAQLAENTHLGTCLEKSAVLVNFFRKLGDSFEKELGASVEIFNVVNGDHAFVVIGRDPRSDPNNFATWGKNTVICDPWANTSYFLNEIPKQLAYFEEGDENLSIPFHPFYNGLKAEQKQAISVIRQGFRLLHEKDPELALVHAVATENISLALKTINQLCEHKDIKTGVKVYERLLAEESNKQFPELLMQELIRVLPDIRDHLSPRSMSIV